MSANNDGGPAFPCSDIVTANGDVQTGGNGMTLRDWFAGQALVGLTSVYTNEASVRKAWECANLMLAYRGKGSN